jgi:hypothetical protein
MSSRLVLTSFEGPNLADLRDQLCDGRGRTIKCTQESAVGICLKSNRVVSINDRFSVSHRPVHYELGNGRLNKSGSLSDQTVVAHREPNFSAVSLLGHGFWLMEWLAICEHAGDERHHQFLLRRVTHGHHERKSG